MTKALLVALALSVALTGFRLEWTIPDAWTPSALLPRTLRFLTPDHHALSPNAPPAPTVNGGRGRHGARLSTEGHWEG